MNAQTKLVTAVCVGSLVFGTLGCGQESTSEDAEVSQAAETPESRARANSDEGAAALAESDKGVDEDGERVWKQDAREYYDFAKYPKNRTFEMPPQWAREITAKLYTAGAPAVWVTRISATDIGDTRINMSDDLLIVLPSEPPKRKAFFEIYNSTFEDEELKFPDVGQKYILFVAD